MIEHIKENNQIQITLIIIVVKVEMLVIFKCKNRSMKKIK